MTGKIYSFQDYKDRKEGKIPEVTQINDEWIKAKESFEPFVDKLVELLA
jgi:hypothetical protein